MLSVLTQRFRPGLRSPRWRVLAASFAVAWFATDLAHGELRIRDLCRVKGQEENTLHGMGLVFGLNGTGDKDPTTIRSLARMMELMGIPLSADAKGNLSLADLQNVQNVASVYILATIPAAGARQGSQVNCTVTAINAKSLEGGILAPTVLCGPNRADPQFTRWRRVQSHWINRDPARPARSTTGADSSLIFRIPSAETGS